MNFDGERVTIKLPKAPATYTPSDQEQFRREVEKSFGRIPGTIPVPSGRTVKSVGEFLYNNADWNLKDLGAVGDGSFDDLTTIQSVFDVVDDAGGGRIVVPAYGTFIIGGTVSYGDNTTISGKGRNSVIALADNLALVDTLRTGIHIMFQPKAVGVVGLIVEAITFDQRSDVYLTDGHSQAFSIDGTIGATFRDCYFMRCQTMPIWCDNHGTQDLLIDGCRFMDGAAGGVSLFGVHTNFRIANCHFENGRDDCIAIQDSINGRPENGVILGCTFKNNNLRDATGSTAHAVNVFGARNVIVFGCESQYTGAEGFIALAGAYHDVENVTFVACIATYSHNSPMSLAGVPGGGFTVRSARANPLGATFAKKVSFVACIATFTGGPGFVANDADDIVFEACQSYFNENDGVAVYTSRNVSVNGCIILDNGSTGVEPYGVLVTSVSPTNQSDGVYIRGCRIGDTRTGGSKTQQYGVFISGGANAGIIRVEGSDLRGNSVAPNGGSFSVDTWFIDNPGLNPIGVVGQTLGASPWTFTALTSPENIHFYGLNLTKLEKIDPATGTAVTVATATPCSVRLLPSQSLVLTYAFGGPSMVRDIE